MGMSSVAVVIPCYRYGHLLRESVYSALDQPGLDVRVLIIDDASGDGSADIARDIAANDSRVDLIVHEQNRGHIATYNEGLLEWCQADYVALLSADDRLTTGALSRAVELLDANPCVGFAYGHVLRFSDSETLPPARIVGAGWTIYDGQKWLARRFRHGNGCITSPEVVVRTSLQRKVGGYRSDLPHTADIEMWMRLAAHADVGYLRGVDQAYYRTHAGNMSSAYLADGGAKDLDQRLAAYESLINEFSGLINDRFRLERSLRRKLATEALYRAARAMDRDRRSVSIDELVRFAERTYPGAHRLPQFASVRVRRTLGPTWATRLQLSTAPAALRRAQRWYWWRTWDKQGI
jgi:glycosyltransferase involved in cell wall biosynthesis